LERDLTSVKRPDIFSFDHPLEYLEDLLRRYVAEGYSYRELVSRCELGAPNFFQRILKGERKLTLKSAKAIASGFQFEANEADYWLLLVRESVADGPEKVNLQKQRSSLRQIAERKFRSDDSIHLSWLHSVVYEMAAIPDFQMTAESIQKRLKRKVSLDEIRQSLDFLRKKKWLVSKGQDRYRQNPIEFDPAYDARSIAMIDSHSAYLDMAKHRLRDDVRETEFLGLTVASSRKNFGRVQEILRGALDDIEKVCGEPGADEVIAIQISAFKLTDSNGDDELI